MFPHSIWIYISTVSMWMCIFFLIFAFRLKLGMFIDNVYTHEQKKNERFEKFEFLMFGGLSFTLVFLSSSMIGLNLFVCLIFASISAYLGPAMISNKRRERYLAAFDTTLNEALVSISSSLKAGLTLPDSLEMVARNSAPPFNLELENAIKSYHLGIPLEEAIRQLKQRVNSSNGNIAFGALLIGNRLGGNLPMILNRIASTLRERQRVTAKLKSLTAQGRTQGSILAAAPPGVAFFIWIWDPQKFALLTDTILGQFLLALAITLEVIGILITKKILKLEI